ncbi:MAG: hypothetical protein QM640_15825 [Niabella sp.]
MDKRRNVWVLLGIYSIICCTDITRCCRHGRNAANPYLSRLMANEKQPQSDIIATSYIYADVHAAAQRPTEKLNWKQLEDVRLIQKWHIQFQQNVLYPVFGNKIKQFAGRQVSISGYMIPVDINAGMYVLSKSNYAACFFCGMAGPETVISLKFNTHPRKYQTDEYVTLKGTLELNVENVNDLFYVFRNTEELK